MSSVDCRRAQAIADQLTLGAVVPPEDNEVLRAHTSSCSDCSSWSVGLEVLSRDPLEPHFSLTRSESDHIIARSVEAAMSAAPVASVRQWSGPWLAVAASLLVLVGGFAVLEVLPALSETPRAMRLVLAAGPRDPGVDPLVAGQPVNVGDVVRSGEQTVGLSLGADAQLLLQPDSEIRIAHSELDEVRIFVDRGSLFGRVNKSAAGARFTFLMPSGEVEIVGTRFTISAGAESAVAVYRGKVRVRPRDAGMQMVSGGQRLFVREARFVPLEAGERAKGLELNDRLSVLAPERAGKMEISSKPSGLMVEVDGVDVGRTPVSAWLKAGGHRVVISRGAEHRVVDEVTLVQGESISRSYDLREQEQVEEPADAVEYESSEPSARVAIPKSVAEQLRRARTLRAKKRWKEAAKAYESLLRSHPHDLNAAAALLSLGSIELEHLARPRAALRHCESYVRDNPSGVLRIEAELCSIRALYKLGRTAKERRAIEAFIERFPESMEAGRLRDRLDQLSSTESDKQP